MSIAVTFDFWDTTVRENHREMRQLHRPTFHFHVSVRSCVVPVWLHAIESWREPGAEG